MKVRKAVIPAAGFGTRFLPVTKAQPKEMIPVVDKPVIQYVVEEAVESGITDILLIIGRGKRAIEEYFDRSWELEKALEEKGKIKQLNQLREITNMANIHFVWQKELKGLGHAIMHAKTFVGDEPFAVLLGDTLLASDTVPVTRQLIVQYNKKGKSVVALEHVPPELTHRYGVIDGVEVEKGLFRANDFVEKPEAKEAPSSLAVASRYIFTPSIFDMLEKTRIGLNGEIQLTDAMRMLLKREEMFGYCFDGVRYDIGNKLNFIKTNLIYGLKNNEIGSELKAWLAQYQQ